MRQVCVKNKSESNTRLFVKTSNFQLQNEKKSFQEEVALENTVHTLIVRTVHYKNFMEKT